MTNDDFAEQWTRCAPYLEAALCGTHSLGDVLNEVLNQNAVFWPLANGAVVTTIMRYPRRRVCRVWLAGGDLDELRRYLPGLDNYARSEGCTHIEVDGRKGWSRVLPGYTAERVVLTKEI